MLLIYYLFLPYSRIAALTQALAYFTRVGNYPSVSPLSSLTTVDYHLQIVPRHSVQQIPIFGLYSRSNWTAT